MGQSSSVIHSFSDSLRLSKENEDRSFWLETYQKAFPTMCSAVSVRTDGWAQRGGIDRILTLACGRIVTIDEKVRHKDYGDILLERWSDLERKSDGWIVKPVACDYLAYAILPSSVCYLFPVLELQRAWRNSGQEWATKAKRGEPGYKIVRALNKSWTTINIAVPIEVVFSAIKDAMTVGWSSGSNEGDA